MITDPARFTLDTVEHMRTLDGRAKADHLNLVISDICELDNEPAVRVMHHILITFSDIDIDTDHVPNFRQFHKKYGKYAIESVRPGSDEWKKFLRLYTPEDIKDK